MELIFLKISFWQPLRLRLPRALWASRESQSLGFSDLQTKLLLSETISTLPKNLGPLVECLVMNFTNLIKHAGRVSKSVLAGMWETQPNAFWKPVAVVICL